MGLHWLVAETSAFAVTAEDAPLGILRRWRLGEANPALAVVPEADRIAAGVSPGT